MKQPSKTHQPCPHPDCGSSDACSYWDTDEGHTWKCHSCGNSGFVKEDMTVEVSGKKVHAPRTMVDRGISKEAIAKFGVEFEDSKMKFPYYSQTGEVDFKYRTQDKQFYTKSNISSHQLFGQQLFPSGGSYVTITEGELDALACWTMFGAKYTVVSVRGSSCAVKDCQANYDWLNSFENIILAFDNDPPGQKAANEVAMLFPGKVKIMKMSHNDPCDYKVTVQPSCLISGGLRFLVSQESSQAPN